MSMNERECKVSVSVSMSVSMSVSCGCTCVCTGVCAGVCTCACVCLPSDDDNRMILISDFQYKFTCS